MAGLKKAKKKEPSSNPNTVLIIFLVFFVLVSLGLGTWVYYAYDAQTSLREAAAKAQADAKAQKAAADFYRLLSVETRAAIGDPLLPEEVVELKGFHDALATGRFNTEKSAEATKKLVDEIDKALGSDADKKPKTTFKQELDVAKAKVKTLEASLADASAQKLAMEKLAEDTKKAFDDFQQTVNTRLQTDNQKVLTAANKQSEGYVKAIEQISALQKELGDKAREAEDRKNEHEKEIRTLNAKLKILDNPAGKEEGGPIVRRSSGDSFPLMLDVSAGKPLWDAPVGKIVRYDPAQRQVTINIGSNHGVKPELTFNVFGTNTAGRAEKHLKATIEVIRVSPTNAQARITSLYDAEGKEIGLNDRTRVGLIRETEAPIREGDLLFNMFWGTRVAIAGYVHFPAEKSDNPAEQVRQMDDFMDILRRNGMQVDAYVDMRDGQLHGAVNANTRYLILGDELFVPREQKAVKQDDPMAEGKIEAGGDRRTAINNASQALRKAAHDNGLLLISARNFATVIGFRPAGFVGNQNSPFFTPSLPVAGSGQGGVLVDQPKQPNQPEAP